MGPVGGASTSRKGSPRVHWSVDATWALIRLWEDRLEDLRRAKRNGAVYAEIAEALGALGFRTTRDQVHNKIENLCSTYRKHAREGTTTGSGKQTWAYYFAIHRFMGSLPLNNSSLVVESCLDRATPAVVQLLAGLQDGGAEDGEMFEEPPMDVGDDSHDVGAAGVGFEAPDLSGHRGESLAASSRRASTASTSCAASTSASNGVSVPARAPPKKRAQHPNTALIRAAIEEQKLLRLSFEAARAKEFELRERELVQKELVLQAQERALKQQERAAKAQEDLTAAMIAFLNKAPK
ncbi:uncharacterized protein LOC120849594 [Ixodes scapularis]|uniref:uncharacterized protein LOC120849594 n=1 Tax=Ixodes scapularis TaxID=6945 RepID=UPI001A9E1E29|nr:uncharacterized protein LOC120849594 [Ixodes scapularis]